MKLKKIAIAAAIGAASTFAMAGGFDGPFVQLGIGGAATSTYTQGIAASNSNVNLNGSSTQGSVNGLVTGGYSQDLGALSDSLKGFNLAANLFYVIGNQNAGNPSSTGLDGWGDTRTLNSTNKLKNTWGISVEPGWNFTESTLGFVKLAWVNTQLNTAVNYSNSDGNSGGNGSVDTSKTLNGFGYGIGVKQMLSSNIYAGVDLMGVTYSSYKPSGDFEGTSFRPTQFMGFASIGYKF